MFWDFKLNWFCFIKQYVTMETKTENSKKNLIQWRHNKNDFYIFFFLSFFSSKFFIISPFVLNAFRDFSYLSFPFVILRIFLQRTSFIFWPWKNNSFYRFWNKALKLTQFSLRLSVDFSSIERKKGQTKKG